MPSALTAYVDTVSNRPLLARAPTAGSVAGTTTADTLGITEWTLSNGVKVVLKPTTFKQDEIVFRAISPGGTSLASDAEYIPAETADAVVAQGGLGDFSRIDLDKVLAGTTASVRADIGPTEEGLSGGAAQERPRDDVPVDLPDLYCAARRSGGVQGVDRAVEDHARQSRGAAGHDLSTARSTPH